MYSAQQLAPSYKAALANHDCGWWSRRDGAVRQSGRRRDGADQQHAQARKSQQTNEAFSGARNHAQRRLVQAFVLSSASPWPSGELDTDGLGRAAVLLYKCPKTCRCCEWPYLKQVFDPSCEAARPITLSRGGRFPRGGEGAPDFSPAAPNFVSATRRWRRTLTYFTHLPSFMLFVPFAVTPSSSLSLPLPIPHLSLPCSSTTATGR